MAARPVRVPVLELFLRRCTHLDDLDVEHERLARERVVEIEIDVEVPDLHGARVPDALARVHGHHLSRHDLAASSRDA